MTKQNHLIIEDYCITFCGQFTGLYVDRRPNTDLSFLKAFWFEDLKHENSVLQSVLRVQFLFHPK